MAGYRDKESHFGKSPEARWNQIKNLRSTKRLMERGYSPEQILDGRHKTEPPAGSVHSATPTPSTPAREDLSSLSIIDFLSPPYYGPGLYPGQRVILKAIYGLPLEGDEEWHIYHTLTGGKPYMDVDGQIYEPQFPRAHKHQHGEGAEAVEVVVACGARGGKSTAIATGIVCYESICRGDRWRQYLRDGETGYAVIVATSREQAQAIIQKNCAIELERSEKLKDYIAEPPTATEITLTNGMKIKSMPCNGVAGRGIPVYCLVFDEFAHFRVEGKNTDESVYESLSPRLAQFPDAKTVFVSTPAAMQGMMYQWTAQGFDVDGRATFQAPSKVLNPTIPDKYLLRQKRTNKDNHEREFLARFAKRISQFFPPEALEGCFILDSELAPKSNIVYYLGIDQSGLTGRDRFAVSVAHQERDGRVVQDLCRAYEVTDDDLVMAEISEIAASYNIKTVYRDRYAAGWVDSRLRAIGLDPELAQGLPLTYQNAKSIMSAGKLFLQASEELENGMAGTMAVYGRNNTLSIAHQRTQYGHADMADATVRSVYAASVIHDEKPEPTEERAAIFNFDPRALLG